VVFHYWFIKPLHGIRAIRLTSIDLMASENSSSTLSFNTIVHMFTIKLSSTNFLLWRSQVVPLLQCQKLYGYVDGSTPMPSATADPAAHNLWKQFDQLVTSLLLSSLTEETLSITIGLTTSRDVWNSLETTFSHKSKVHELQIKDELHLMKRGSRSIFEYSQIFKAHYDQLSAMGRPVENTNKVH